MRLRPWKADSSGSDRQGFSTAASCWHGLLRLTIPRFITPSILIHSMRVSHNLFHSVVTRNSRALAPTLRGGSSSWPGLVYDHRRLRKSFQDGAGLMFPFVDISSRSCGEDADGFPGHLSARLRESKSTEQIAAQRFGWRGTARIEAQFQQHRKGRQLREIIMRDICTHSQGHRTRGARRHSRHPASFSARVSAREATVTRCAARPRRRQPRIRVLRRVRSEVRLDRAAS